MNRDCAVQAVPWAEHEDEEPHAEAEPEAELPCRDPIVIGAPPPPRRGRKPDARSPPSPMEQDGWQAILDARHAQPEFTAPLTGGAEELVHSPPTPAEPEALPAPTGPPPPFEFTSVLAAVPQVTQGFRVLVSS